MGMGVMALLQQKRRVSFQQFEKYHQVLSAKLIVSAGIKYIIDY